MTQLADALANSKLLDLQVIGTTATLASGLSAGYILWLLRSGTLLASVLSTLPAWKVIDPLPILDSLGSDANSDDTETLQSMVSETADAENDPDDHPRPHEKAA